MLGQEEFVGSHVVRGWLTRPMHGHFRNLNRFLRTRPDMLHGDHAGRLAKQDPMFRSRSAMPGTPRSSFPRVGLTEFGDTKDQIVLEIQYENASARRRSCIKTQQTSGQLGAAGVPGQPARARHPSGGGADSRSQQCARLLHVWRPVTSAPPAIGKIRGIAADTWDAGVASRETDVAGRLAAAPDGTKQAWWGRGWE